MFSDFYFFIYFLPSKKSVLFLISFYIVLGQEVYFSHFPSTPARYFFFSVTVLENNKHLAFKWKLNIRWGLVDFDRKW